jgi:predicted membrane-bound spermidine synthase
MSADSRPIPGTLLHAVFFVSGFSAILYQLVWQRSLFTAYGTSSESVTMVVTAFMLGLGLGSLAGGALSQSASWLLPALFTVAELAIGAFGLASLKLFYWVASVTSDASGLEVGLTAFALLLAPTMCMGATLPLLVAYSVGRTRNVGGSVGMLYFANTLGSAAGCAAAADFIFGRLGQAGTVQLAAGGNALVAACVLATLLYRRTAR